MPRSPSVTDAVAQEWKINAGIIVPSELAPFPPPIPIARIESPDSPAALAVTNQISEFRRQLKVCDPVEGALAHGSGSGA